MYTHIELYILTVLNLVNYANLETFAKLFHNTSEFELVYTHKVVWSNVWKMA